MLDINLIRYNLLETKHKLSSRAKNLAPLVDQVYTLDSKKRNLQTEIEKWRALRNKQSKAIGLKKLQGEKVEEEFGALKEIGFKIEEKEKELANLEIQLNSLLLSLPNLPHESVPCGGSEANQVVRTWGEPPQPNFPMKTHWELGKELGILDLERSAKLSGSGFSLFLGKGAKLQRALIHFMLEMHTQNHGYQEVWPPYLVREACMMGTGHLPKFANDMYSINNDGLYLIPTGEVPLTNLHREEILSESSLPLRYVAYTPCFRLEAGSAGKDTRGILRLHQFDKVELVQITKPEDSYGALEEMVKHAENVLQALNLCYRVVLLASEDMGFGAAKCYDIEVWAAGIQSWLEISSVSNLENFQARRMNLRYKSSSGKNILCHTLNGSGTALPRLVAAILENNQKEDGRVLIPEKIRAYFGEEYL
ncbi:serine--tRNA ligase [Candidatus Methylacidiphilum fumarolicum]|uniref:Serine--tRNA ligase n=2 Tax=Candidatus Methylacidiphilum fumarolicum TaxID=591154 RepID=I0JXP3_METFB|nr:serine--tRNA ligase [Candidatus Methylacidiphilum fumarolicum]MBW6415384.1 serine--tRNA ligase [Candidatus Methylacidiphilum fumarolicum]TFE69155.1 serine--tRNA ligase [Candidatus Methylacidiphilum fumarolicum]TFE72792.1 serine--tRNA ligase [Candidatus Methylacidiphilum fumarolicum]TFE74671.1 serine--tRNA ligase [Candidatus Methylacidiphilum fumarolicum]TFE77726.1 serine--tRNA ligase [Candidatus Methylacidiphilum fumarolicum]